MEGSLSSARMVLSIGIVMPFVAVDASSLTGMMISSLFNAVPNVKSLEI